MNSVNNFANMKSVNRDCSRQSGHRVIPLLVVFPLLPLEILPLCNLKHRSTPHSLSFTIPRVCSNSYPFSQWRHPTVSSSVPPSSSCPQSFPESGSFPVSWLFTSVGWSIGASASASVLPMGIQGWLPLGLPGSISLQWDSPESLWWCYFK